MEKMYKDFARYGTIINSFDYDFPQDRKFVTMKVIQLDGIKALFILVNGEVKQAEYLSYEDKRVT